MELILSPANYFLNPHAIPFFISGTLIIIESIFVFLQNRRAILNISFSGITLFVGIWLTGIGFIYSSANEPTAYIWSRYYDWLGIIFITPFVYLFSTVLGGKPTQGKKRFAKLNFGIALGIYTFCVVTDDFIYKVWDYPWGYYPAGHIAEFLFILWFYALMTLSFVNFVSDYKQETTPFIKKRIRLVIIAFIFGFIGSLDFIANFGIPLYPIGSVALLIYTSMLGYTIVNYRLMDIETVFHKTLLWILSFFIISVPILIVYRWVFSYMIGSPVLQTVFGVLSFIILAIYLRLIQPKIDHVFQRRSADMEAILNRFIEDLVHLKGLNNLIRYIEQTIADTLYPQWVDIFIYNEKEKTYVKGRKTENGERPTEFNQDNDFLRWFKGHNRIVYKDFIEVDPSYASVKEAARDYFDLTQATVVIPIVLGEQLLGVIHLSKKANLRRYRGLDFQFLTVLRNQAAIAISNSLIYQNIEEQVALRTEELLAVQKQLVQAEKLATVGTLSGGVAHEINNPLTAILTNVQMLLAFSDDQEPGEYKESLRLIEEATQRCRTIVQKLMDYAKKPMKTSETSRVNVLDVLEKTVAFLEYQLGQENIKIVLQAEKGDYPVLGNQNELEQVLTNFILNARDAIVSVKKKGDIRIFLSKVEGQIRIRVEDDGKGIEKEALAKIFDPFFTTKDVGKGLGLGLSICHSIIEKHKGRIKVRSEEGKGTAFTMVLPRYSPMAGLS